jgi:hypothetical protein
LKPRLVAGGLALACLAIGIFIAASVSTEPATREVSYQAGYVWCCHATDVRATWVIPRIHPDGDGPSTAVWIAVKDKPSPEDTFFLQVGFLANSSGAGGVWSDNRLSYNPQFIGNALAPGTRLFAELRRTAGGWIVILRNLTHRHTSLFFVKTDC